ncbi:MFS general substrate transporter [Hyaloscypha variabilis F]|uniref:MFS general substrate transporter n=1 Tax=Hyaloscypha variabilis (strain UAMH 11265 / GT02V1 / F) TaxID=1149755 RepID=A0A2J6S8F0_HYAVF|nr:MFS general substrate transporter [Hyaloscypha variabilis F]
MEAEKPQAMQLQSEAETDCVEERIESTPEHIQKAEDVARLEALSFEYTDAEEGRLLMKLDIIVLGYVSGAYLLAYMDRGNIGNANTAGMSKDLGIDDNQYQWLLTTVFYKIFPARYYVPTVICIWGIIAGACGAAQNFAGMLVLRLLLGIFESSYSPGLAYFFSFFYYRKEMARRLGWYVSIAPLAASFAGSFAYFVTLHHHAIAGWRVLFLVEGLPAILIGLFGYYWLPSNALDCQFLTEKEKNIARARTVRQNWLTTIMYFLFNVSYSSLPIYVPAILQGMGYTSIRAQGLSAPPYLFAAFVVLFIGFMSDRFQRRGIFLALCSGTGAVGYLILILVDIVAVKYFALFLVTGGLYPCIGLVLSWVSNNNGNDSKRGAAFILMNFVGQCGPLLGTHIFPLSEAPLYHKGFYISFGACTLAALLAFVQIAWLKHLNNRLDAKCGRVQEEVNIEDEIGNETESSTNFRFIL